jgi:hypothetical protein
MASVYPPLGSTHIVSGSSAVRFAALPQDGLQGDFTVQIWSNISGTWREHDLEEQSALGNIHVAYIPIHEPARAKSRLFEQPQRVRALS